MSHSLKAHTVRVVYRVRMVVGAPLKRVKPLWLRANGCSKHPSYDIEGDQPPGSVHTKQSLWRMPLSGRIVAASGHLHGSSYGADRQAAALRGPPARSTSKPLYGYRRRHRLPRQADAARARADRHRACSCRRTGIPVRKGEMLKVTGLYDGSRPHPRVMAITHVYVAVDRDAPRACARDARRTPTSSGRARTAARSRRSSTCRSTGSRDGKVVEIDRPPGAERVVELDRDAGRTSAGERFMPANLSVARGTRVVWTFTDPSLHNILLASGPRHVASTTLTKGGALREDAVHPGHVQAVLLPAPDHDDAGHRRAPMTARAGPRSVAAAATVRRRRARRAGVVGDDAHDQGRRQLLRPRRAACRRSPSTRNDARDVALDRRVRRTTSRVAAAR